jgi:hypothetical protein
VLCRRRNEHNRVRQELEKLKSGRLEAWRGCSACATAAARCRPGGVGISVAHTGEGQQGRARAAAGVQVTRGVREAGGGAAAAAQRWQ